MDISCSNQARREKARKGVRQATSQIGRSPSRGKSLGPFRRARGYRHKEAGFVRCWLSSDCEGGEKAVGEGQEAGEEGRRLDPTTG